MTHIYSVLDMEYKTHSPINQYLVGNLIREFAESATFFDNPYALEVLGESEHKLFDYNDAIGELKKEESTRQVIQSLEICEKHSTGMATLSR